MKWRTLTSSSSRRAVSFLRVCLDSFKDSHVCHRLLFFCGNMLVIIVWRCYTTTTNMVNEYVICRMISYLIHINEDGRRTSVPEPNKQCHLLILAGLSYLTGEVFYLSYVLSSWVIGELVFYSIKFFVHRLHQLSLIFLWLSEVFFFFCGWQFLRRSSLGQLALCDTTMGLSSHSLIPLEPAWVANECHNVSDVGRRYVN